MLRVFEASDFLGASIAYEKDLPWPVSSGANFSSMRAREELSLREIILRLLEAENRKVLLLQVGYRVPGRSHSAESPLWKDPEKKMLRPACFSFFASQQCVHFEADHLCRGCLEASDWSGEGLGPGYPGQVPLSLLATRNPGGGVFTTGGDAVEVVTASVSSKSKPLAMRTDVAAVGDASMPEAFKGV